MHRVRATGLLTATTLALASLAACGGDNEPDPTTSTASPIDKGTDEPSSSSTTSTDGTTDGSDGVPPAAQKNTKAGAMAFTELWFEKSGTALQNGDSTWIRSHAHKECAPCTALADKIDSDNSEGVVADRDPISLKDMKATTRSDNGYRVEFTMENPAYAMVDEDGAAVRRFKPITVTVVTDTHWNDGQWILKGWITK